VRSLEEEVDKLRQANAALEQQSPFAVQSNDTPSEIEGSAYQPDGDVRAGDGDRWVSEISVDNHGEVRYHGPTSSFRETLAKDPGLDPINVSSSHGIQAVEDYTARHSIQIKHILVSNAAAQRHVEELAVEGLSSVESDIPSEMASELLKYHWCWIHPTFQFVYRPAFTRESELIPWAIVSLLMLAQGTCQIRHSRLEHPTSRGPC
jgi:hypothetical protein